MFPPVQTRTLEIVVGENCLAQFWKINAENFVILSHRVSSAAGPFI